MADLSLHRTCGSSRHTTRVTAEASNSGILHPEITSPVDRQQHSHGSDAFDVSFAAMRGDGAAFTRNHRNVKVPGRRMQLRSVAWHQWAALALFVLSIGFLLVYLLLGVLLFEMRNLTVVESQFQVPKGVLHGTVSASSASTCRSDALFPCEGKEEAEAKRANRRAHWGEHHCMLGAVSPALDPTWRAVKALPLLPDPFSWALRARTQLTRWLPTSATGAAGERDDIPQPVLASETSSSFSDTSARWYYCSMTPTAFPVLSQRLSFAETSARGEDASSGRKLPLALRAVPIESQSLLEQFCLFTSHEVRQARLSALTVASPRVSLCGLEEAVPDLDATQRLPRGWQSATQDGEQNNDDDSAMMTASLTLRANTGERNAEVPPGIHTILYFQRPQSSVLSDADGQPAKRQKQKNIQRAFTMKGRDHVADGSSGGSRSGGLQPVEKMDFVYSYVNGSEPNRLFRRSVWKNCAPPLQTLEYLWFLHQGRDARELHAAPVRTDARSQGAPWRSFFESMFTKAEGSFARTFREHDVKVEAGLKPNVSRETILAQLLASSSVAARCEPILRTMLSLSASSADFPSHASVKVDRVGAERSSTALRNGQLLDIIRGDVPAAKNYPWASTVDSLDADADELRFSIRSVFGHTRHWHQGRYMVVLPSGQVPAWLDLAVNFVSLSRPRRQPFSLHEEGVRGHHLQDEHLRSDSNPSAHAGRGPLDFPRLHLIDQAALLPYGLDLTSDSFTIESQMYKVQDLSDVFLYLNDDYFFRSRVDPSDLVNQLGGPVIRLTGNFGDAEGPGAPEWEVRREARASFRYEWHTSALNTIVANIRTHDMGRATDMWAAAPLEESEVGGSRRTSPPRGGVKRFYEDVVAGIDSVGNASAVHQWQALASHSVLSALQDVSRRLDQRRGNVAAFDKNNIQKANHHHHGEEAKDVLSWAAAAAASADANESLSLSARFQLTEAALTTHAMPRTFDPRTYMKEVWPFQKYRRRAEMHSPFVICRNMHRHLHTRSSVAYPSASAQDADVRKAHLHRQEEDDTVVTDQKKRFRAGNTAAMGHAVHAARVMPTTREASSAFPLLTRSWAHRERNSSDLLFPFLYTDAMLRMPWAASAKYLPYLADKQRFYATWRDTSHHKARTEQEEASLRAPSVVMDLDNRDGCAPATLLIGDRAAQSTYHEFTDVAAHNANVMASLERERAHHLFVNINSKYTKPEVAAVLKQWMEKEYPLAVPTEKAAFREVVSKNRNKKANAASHISDGASKDHLHRTALVREWFAHLMHDIPLVLLASHWDGLCPLLRSMQMALPGYGQSTRNVRAPTTSPFPFSEGATVARSHQKTRPRVFLVVAGADAEPFFALKKGSQARKGTKGKSSLHATTPYDEAKRRHPFRHFMPVTACDFFASSRRRHSTAARDALHFENTSLSVDVEVLEVRGNVMRRVSGEQGETEVIATRAGFREARNQEATRATSRVSDDGLAHPHPRELAWMIEAILKYDMGQKTHIPQVGKPTVSADTSEQRQEAPSESPQWEGASVPLYPLLSSHNDEKDARQGDRGDPVKMEGVHRVHALVIDSRRAPPSPARRTSATTYSQARQRDAMSNEGRDVLHRQGLHVSENLEGDVETAARDLVGALAVPGELLGLENFRVLQLRPTALSSSRFPTTGNVSEASGTLSAVPSPMVLVISRALEESEDEASTDASRREGETSSATLTNTEKGEGEAVLPRCVCPPLSSSLTTLPFPALRLLDERAFTPSVNAPARVREGVVPLCSCVEPQAPAAYEDGTGASRSVRRHVPLPLRPRIHWVRGATEKDLLGQYPLPYDRFEDREAMVRWFW